MVQLLFVQLALLALQLWLLVFWAAVHQSKDGRSNGDNKTVPVLHPLPRPEHPFLMSLYFFCLSNYRANKRMPVNQVHTNYIQLLTLLGVICTSMYQ